MKNNLYTPIPIERR